MAAYAEHSIPQLSFSMLSEDKNLTHGKSGTLSHGSGSGEHRLALRSKTDAVPRLQMRRSQTLEPSALAAAAARGILTVPFIELKAACSDSNGILIVKVLQARNLVPAKKGKQNSYCMLAVSDLTLKTHERKVDVKKEHFRTATVEGTDPAWNETKELVVPGLSSSGKSELILRIEVREDTKDKFLGSVQILLANVVKCETTEMWYPLERQKKTHKVSGDIKISLLLGPLKKIPEQIALQNENFPSIPSFLYNSYWPPSVIKSLVLTRCTITSFPEGLGNLTSLKLLDLSCNSITSLPSSIGNLRQLSVLDLHSNRLKILPQEIAQLQQLMFLNLKDNAFPSAPDILAKLKDGCQVDIDCT